MENVVSEYDHVYDERFLHFLEYVERETQSENPQDL